RRAGQRPGPLGRAGAATLRAFLHDQDPWDRPGPVDLQADRRGTRRSDHGRPGSRPRRPDPHRLTPRRAMSVALRIAIAADGPRGRANYGHPIVQRGHRLTSAAETGRELVEGCRAARPDLIVTDIKMPDMEGIEAVAEICRDEPIPVILVSA